MGYDVIDQLLTGKLIVLAILVFMVVKSLMWIFYLGSGTSGGVLAPLLALGAGLGRLEAMNKEPVVAFPDGICQSVAIRMAVEKLERIPVVDKHARAARQRHAL